MHRAPVRRAPVPSSNKPVAVAASDEAGFLERAWAMEVEAAERYALLADVMEAHNNAEVAELFRKLARIEQLHADQLQEGRLGRRAPAMPPAGMDWGDGEGPESPDPGDLHYRMRPHHALKLALACEQGAVLFFEQAERVSTVAAVREAAREMAAEEREHVRLIEDWLKRTPLPPEDWEEDPDPPVFVD